MVWARMPNQRWTGAAAAFLTMWLVMMVAMMVPSLVPLLATLPHRGLAALAGAGYFAVWTLFGSAVYVLGVAVVAAELRWPAAARYGPLAAGVVLCGAGCVQLTAWKANRLARCRGCAPPASLDAASAFRHGVRFGVECALCCTGLMAVLLVAGMMNLAVVALVAAAITLERWAPGPERTARAIGIAIAGIGVLAVVRAVVGH
jgi:predicted metal-binding membrane protein